MATDGIKIGDQVSLKTFTKLAMTVEDVNQTADKRIVVTCVFMASASPEIKFGREKFYAEALIKVG